MSDSIEMTSCIRHKDTARYFIYYEDFQDLSKKHPDKLAAFLRVLEVKTNKRIASYAVLLEDAVNNNQPLPMLNLWHEVSYNDFVNWSLETLGRSSFQIADKVAEEMLLVRSKVLTRKLRPDDEHSPELTYKIYILVLENVQAMIDSKELPITGEAYEKYGEEPPVIENIPLLKKTWGMLEKTRGDMLKKTAPPVEKNYFKDKNKDNTSKENNKEDTLASDDALSLLQEITNRFGGVEQVLSLLEKLSTQSQQLPTSNTQDNSSSTAAVGGNTDSKQPVSHSQPAIENVPAIPPSNKGTSNRGKNKVTQSSFMEEEVQAPTTPQEPSAEMKWGTRKCMMLFDYWRGAPKLTHRKICDASAAGKQLSSYYTEDEVRLAKKRMDAKQYYKDRNGADIEDVANNIQQYIKKSHLTVVNATSQHTAPVASTEGSQYIVNELTEVAEGYLDKMEQEELMLVGIGD